MMINNQMLATQLQACEASIFSGFDSPKCPSQKWKQDAKTREDRQNPLKIHGKSPYFGISTGYLQNAPELGTPHRKNGGSAGRCPDRRL